MPATTVTTEVQPYVFFRGRCQEAIDFYAEAVGARPEQVMRFDESPDPVPEGMLQPGYEHKVMHAAVRIDNTTLLMSDGCGTEPPAAGFSLALQVATEAEADRAFAALAEGGQVTMPLGKTFWSPKFGMLTDRFGIGWMVNVAVPPDA